MAQKHLILKGNCQCISTGESDDKKEETPNERLHRRDDLDEPGHRRDVQIQFCWLA
jgi:hypothetical protein